METFSDKRMAILVSLIDFLLLVIYQVSISLCPSLDFYWLFFQKMMIVVYWGGRDGVSSTSPWRFFSSPAHPSHSGKLVIGLTWWKNSFFLTQRMQQIWCGTKGRTRSETWTKTKVNTKENGKQCYGLQTWNLAHKKAECERYFIHL